MSRNKKKKEKGKRSRDLLRVKKPTKKPMVHAGMAQFNADI